ncbi:double-stranded RNA-binding protein Staufen homolog 1 isoform X7 [Tupaia chinensis]|uniref:double-stranded RNA-binding protein Staufen homolog 1 isoform X7 n=1 Tax=Tupaia chinensis TaxID=246437 RepID=UPI000FFBEB36|nr:double-stranded RNA-binding protein Staufen homolog 1 isoform X7 [Tupaia chinensis]
MSQVQVQVQNPSAALSGSQILNKNQSLLSQPLMSIPSTASSLPSENAGRPIQNSAFPSASVTSTSAAAESITPTVELNALCMKLGKKPMYKPVDPYSRMQSSYNYSMRGGAYPPRYFYPLPVPPLLYQVELSVGGQQFNGKGKTRQAAKHDAAAKALRILQNEPPPERLEVNGRESEEENLNKSEISQVFEIALKRNLPVNFEVARESGPPHMKNFVTKVSVGEFVGEGEGKSKKISKKNAAIAVLEELKKLPPLPAVERVKPRIKKKTKPTVKLQASPEYGQAMNPISRLAQIQQAKKDKEPEYVLLTERGLPRRREFVMQVKVGNHTAEGAGTNKKVAKRNAAENMLEILGFKVPQAQPTKPALKSEEKTPVKKPGDGRKVTFFEPGSADENGTSHKEDEFRMPYLSHQQLPAGILPMVPEVAQAVGVSQGHHTKDFTRAAPNPAKATVTAMIARELLYGGTSPTAETILKNNISSGHAPHGPLTRPSEQLDYLSRVQGFQVTARAELRGAPCCGHCLGSFQTVGFAPGLFLPLRGRRERKKRFLTGSPPALGLPVGTTGTDNQACVVSLARQLNLGLSCGFQPPKQ